MNNYHGSDNKDIYIPNTYDFIKAGKISAGDKVYITKDLMQTITKNGAVNVTVDDQGNDNENKVYAKGDWSSAFSGYSTNVKSVDFSHIDTSGVTKMDYMFSGSNGLESVNFSGCDLSNVTSSNGMFNYADGNIKEVNLTGTKGVTQEILNEYTKAAKDTNQTTIDLSGVSLSPKITSFMNLFMNMPSLKEVNLTGLDTSAITSMRNMFYGGSNLTTIIGLGGLDTHNVTSMNSMFCDDSSLQSINLSGWDFGKLTDTRVMFDGTNSLKDLNLTGAKNVNRDILDTYATAVQRGKISTVDLGSFSLSPKVTRLNKLFNNNKFIEHVILKGLNIGNVTDMSSMFLGDSNLESVDFSGLDLSNVNTSGMFNWADGSNIKEINLTNTKGVTQEILKEYIQAAKNSKAATIDLSHTTLSPKITSFKGLFADMPNVETIKLNNWKTGNVTDMSYMFNNDPKLTIITGIENWDTHNVTNMAYMFAGLENPTKDDYAPKDFNSFGHLTSLNLSNWDTSNVTNMMFMFAGQTYITNLGNLTTRGNKWDTSKVTNMAGMFNDLENLPDNAFDLTGWDTSNVEDMTHMFHNMYLQENMDFVDNWKTGKVTDMSYMFNSMRSLKALDLSNWDVSSVGLKKTKQNYSLAMMFSADEELTTNLSKWGDKTKNVHDTRQMFWDTPSLIDIDLSGWNTSKLQIAEGMFNGSGAKHINLDKWNLSDIRRITGAGYIEGNPNPDGKPLIRGIANMFKNLTNKAVISMNDITLPVNSRNAFEINDFEGNNPIVVIANGKNGAALTDLLAVNNQTWTNNGKSVIGRQNSDYVTYVRADDNSKQIGRHGLNFIFTNLKDLHDYFDDVTKTSTVKTDLGNELCHDWDAKNDTANDIVKIALRLNPNSSYDPYNGAIHAEKDGYMLADLMTSKYQLHIVAPTTTKETKNPTRTIIIENPDGTTDTEKKTVEFTRNVTKHVDGTEQDTPWTPASGEWNKFDVPQIDGYDSYVDGTVGKVVDAKDINADTANVTVHITYKSNVPATPDNPEPTPGPDNPNPGPDNPGNTPEEPNKPKPETPEVPETPNEPKPENPTTPKENNKHEKNNESENTNPHAESEAKNKKGKKTPNSQIALNAETAPKELVAPKSEQRATGVKELSSKSAPASAEKSNTNKEETLPQTGEKKSDAGILGLGLLTLATLGFVDRKRRD